MASKKMSNGNAIKTPNTVADCSTYVLLTNRWKIEIFFFVEKGSGLEKISNTNAIKTPKTFAVHMHHWRIGGKNWDFLLSIKKVFLYGLESSLKAINKWNRLQHCKIQQTAEVRCTKAESSLFRHNWLISSLNPT